MFLARSNGNGSCYIPYCKVFLSLLLLFYFSFLSAQYQNVVINEVSGDGGNIEARNDAIVELAGPPGTDIGCMVITNTEWAVVLPANTKIPLDGVFIIGCEIGNNGGSAVYTSTSSGLSCSVCDFPGLVVDFDVCNSANANYISTSLYTTYGFTLDNGYCGKNSDGDQVILFRPDGTPHDALYWGTPDLTNANGGDTTFGGASSSCGSAADHVAAQLGQAYLLGDNDDNGIVNDYIGTHVGFKGNGGNATGVNKMPTGNDDLGNPFVEGAVVSMPVGDCKADTKQYIVPPLDNGIWVNAGLALVGCNSTHIRLNDSSPTGNSEQKKRPFTNSSHRDDPDLNADWLSFVATNLVPSSSNHTAAAQQWQVTNHPNPGKPNDVDSWDFFYDIGNGPIEITSADFLSIPLCEASTIQFTLQVYNHQQVEPAIMTNNKAGSFIQNEMGANLPWDIISVGSSQTNGNYMSNEDGITTFQFTSNLLSLGTSNDFTLVWDDYTDCCGSGSTTSVVSQASPNECYERMKLRVTVSEPFQVIQTTLNCPDDFEEGIGMVDISNFIAAPNPYLQYTLKENVVTGQEKTTGNVAATSTTGIVYLPTHLTEPIAIIVEDMLGCSSPQVISIGANCKAEPPCPALGTVTISKNILCPSETFTLAMDAGTSSNLPDGGQIDWYYGTEATFDPHDPTSAGYVGILSQASSITITGPNCPNDGGNIFISELSDPQDDWACHRYIEIYNGGPCVQDLTGWMLYAIGNNNKVVPFSLSGNIAVGQALIASASCATNFISDFAIPNDEDWAEGMQGNFNGQSRDGAILYDNMMNQVDIAVLNTEDTNSWFTDNVAIRRPSICEGFRESETLCGMEATCAYLEEQWLIMADAMNATPGTHAINETTCPNSINTTIIAEAINQLDNDFCNQTLYLKGIINPAVATSTCPISNFTTNTLSLTVECPEANLVVEDVNLCTPVSAQEILTTVALTGGSGLYDLTIEILTAGNSIVTVYENIGTPFQLTYSDISAIIGSTIFLDAEVRIRAVSDAQGSTCGGMLNTESIFLTIQSSPTIRLIASTNETDCTLENGTITFEIDPPSSGPWHIEYTVDDGEPLSLSVNESPFTLTTKAGIYEVLSIVSETGCEGVIAAPSSQISSPPTSLSASAISNPTLCDDGNETIHLDTDIILMLDNNGTSLTGNASMIGNITWYKEDPSNLPLLLQNTLQLTGTEKLISPTTTTDYYFIYHRPVDNCETIGTVKIEVGAIHCRQTNTEMPSVTATSVATIHVPNFSCEDGNLQPIDLAQSVLFQIEEDGVMLIGNSATIGNLKWYVQDPINLSTTALINARLSSQEQLIQPSGIEQVLYFIYTSPTASGTYNGRIRLAAASPCEASIPTMTQWGLFLFTLLILNISLFLIGRLEQIHL